MASKRQAQGEVDGGEARPVPPDGIPPLAGLCSHADATCIGYGVEENVSRLLRYHWTEKRLRELEVARIPSTPEWEVKGALSLHQWLDAEHADALPDWGGACDLLS